MAVPDSADGTTPLTSEEAIDLRISVQSKAELNVLERENIIEARTWALGRRTLRRTDLLSEEFLRELHRRMFRRIWRWAGKFRTTERNLDRPAYALAMDVRALLDDARYWLENGTFAPTESAVRFHHRLVLIHPWVNGNGRHARLMADLLVASRGGEPLLWGRGADLVAPSDVRTRYLVALREADAGNFTQLLAFASGAPAASRDAS